MTEKEKLEKISAAVARYYDLLMEEEIAEDRAWGEFAAAQFVEEDRPEGHSIDRRRKRKRR